MKKTLIFLAVIVVLAGAGFAYLQYNKPHRDTVSEEPAYTLDASTLYKAYAADEAAANAKYIDKLLLVKGTIAKITATDGDITSITLETEDPLSGVSFQLLPAEAEKLENIQEGDRVQLKGICTGKLMDVVLVRGVIVE